MFAHEHGHIGIPGFLTTRNEGLEEKERGTSSLAMLLIDIRIVNVNSFYAAAVGTLLLNPISLITSAAIPKISLPLAAQDPKTQEGSRAVPVVNSKLQRSNIVAVSVSPGIGRVDTIFGMLNADWTGTERKTSWLRVFL